MVDERRRAPEVNFEKGFFEFNSDEFGSIKRGKVRDIVTVNKNGEEFLAIITTDRQSAFDRMICTVPGKGQALNLISGYWFEATKDIIPNHMICIPHPNVLIARKASANIPVEIVLRDYMAKSSTSTSVYHNYATLGRREIYGIEFPEGLEADQEFPMGTILTPTTKAEVGHDMELTDHEALEIVDAKLGDGIWEKTKKAALEIFERARLIYLEKGVILVDTKFEFFLDKDGELMLGDEVSPDSSRLWLASSYSERVGSGQNPESFDKDVLRRWLSMRNEFENGEGIVPEVDPAIIKAMAMAYEVPYEMLTGNKLPSSNSANLNQEIVDSIKGFLND